jgi:hypothetical protein
MNAKKIGYSVLGLIIVGLAVVAYAALITRPKAAPVVTSSTGCVATDYSLGSSGTCVSDIQTMVDFIETDNLPGCSFAGGSLLPISGSYDADTASQVKAVQSWANCYAKEEGGSSNITENGIVNANTWSELCSYGYHLPSQATNSSSSYLKASLTAGKNAGC